MKIKSLHRTYVQKSRMFLYPVLGIKRGHSVTPIQTYISWDGRYAQEDCKFICTYHLREDEDFRLLEKVKLTGNPLFHEFIQLDDNIGAYVFDFSERKEDFMNFINGKYSKFSTTHKRSVMGFFKNHSSHHVYIESYMYPQKYFPLYAEMLVTQKSDVAEMYRTLSKVGELCSKPDIDKETLKTDYKSGMFNINPLDLQSDQQNS